ncbi:MAG: hypothetical protein V3W04_15330 [Gammaproteobacteria bacterium]
MHRTQLYFEEELFDDIKKTASEMNLTVSAYIRDVLRKELKTRQMRAQSPDFSGFSGMWKDSDITQESLRKKAWK